MKFTKTSKSRRPIAVGILAIGAAATVTFGFLPHARGELVFENDTQAKPIAVGAQAVVQPQAQPMSMPAQAPVAAAVQAPAQMPTQVIVQQPMQAQPVQAVAMPQHVVIQQAVPAQVAVGDPNVTTEATETGASKSELFRRQRVKEERKNEDVLAERLEQLRLRDEQRRLDQLFAGTGAAAAPMANAPLNAPLNAPMTEQVIGQPVVQPMAPVAVAPAGQAAPVTTVASAPLAGQSMMVATELKEPASIEESGTLQIQPRFGFTEFSGNPGYDIRPRFAGGIGVGVATSENVSFEAGYMYGESGVALGSWLQGYTWNNTAEMLALKENVFELGLKLHFLGREARLRPFIGGGAAYRLSFINYDQSILNALNRDFYGRQFARDYQLSSYLGFLSTGLDIRVNKSVSVGALFKYYSILSSRERSSMETGNGLYGYGYNALATGTIADAEKQFVAGSLSRVNFYTIQAGVTFSF